MMKLFKKLYNYILCLRYPFYKVRNVWTDKFMSYGYTWYDHIPKGWRKAFGKQFSKELKKQLKKDEQLYTFRFSDIKEKWGSLHFYTQGCSEECMKVLDKYKKLSKEYCIYCGKKAKYKTEGYVLYVCEKCFKEEL